jgi:MtN3 and saliva related transmembrane protein
MYFAWFKDIVEIIFSISMFINAILFIPQAIKLFKTKNSQGLSLLTFLGFNCFQFFTALHGFLTKDYILLFGFILSFLTCGVVTVFIILYSHKAK